MIILALYSLAWSKDKGASGGNISNVMLIRELCTHRSVTVVAPNISDALRRELASIGVKVVSHAFPKRGLTARFHKRRWIGEALRAELLDWGREATVVASNGTCDVAHKAIQRFESDNLPRFVILIRAFEDMFYSQFAGSSIAILKGALFDLVSMRRVCKAYRAANLVVANSDFMANAAGNYFGLVPERVAVLYPPIALPANACSIPACPPTIGMVNPKPEKGVRTLLAMAKRFPTWSFVYFGAVDLDFKISNLRYGGWADNAVDLYSQIDILLVPSRWHEPFGRVSAEAIGHGVLALVSDRGGLPETVDDHLVVRSDSVKTWGSAVQSLLASPELANEVWIRSRELASKFSFENHQKTLLNLFSSRD